MNDRTENLERLFTEVEDRLKRLVILAEMENSQPVFFARKLSVCKMQAEWFLEELNKMEANDGN